MLQASAPLLLCAALPFEGAEEGAESYFFPASNTIESLPLAIEGAVATAANIGLYCSEERFGMGNSLDGVVFTAGLP